VAVLAAPLAAADAVEPHASAAPAEPDAETPVDVQSWVRRESVAGFLASEYEADRHALLREGWVPRSPTWIQSTTTVNLGDFPALDNSVERAERDLKTLEWVIEEQRRLAAGKPAAHEGDAQEAPDHWLRRLLPAHWIALLKANREWVAAGGTALLVIVWGTAAFARRPTPPTLPAPPPPSRRRRRRHAGGHTAG
jgi:hypothetical protein